MADQAQKHTFFFYAPYSLDEGTAQRRLSVMAEHRDRVAEMRKTGFIKAGHITTDLASFGLPHDKKKYVGSVLIIESETPEEVQKFIEADVYYTNEVWDKEKITLLPFAYDPFVVA